MISKTLLRSKQSTQTALPLSTKPLISSQKAIRFVRQDFLFRNPCWQLPITSSPVSGLQGYTLLHFLSDQSRLACSSSITPSSFLPVLRELPWSPWPSQDKRMALQWYWPSPFALVDEFHQVPWTSICKICLNVSFLDPSLLKVVLRFFRMCLLFTFFLHALCKKILL